MKEFYNERVLQGRVTMLDMLVSLVASDNICFLQLVMALQCTKVSTQGTVSIKQSSLGMLGDRHFVGYSPETLNSPISNQSCRLHSLRLRR